MKRKPLLVAFIAGLTLVLTAAFALAGPMRGVEISVLTDLDTPRTDPDPYSAIGPAVSTGILSATGTVTTGPYDWPPLPGEYVEMIKYFVCTNGTFDLKLRVWLLSEGHTTGTWKVVAGTGDYANLNGHGELTGTFDPVNNDVLDIYTGKMNLAGPPSTTPPPWAGKK